MRHLDVSQRNGVKHLNSDPFIGHNSDKVLTRHGLEGRNINVYLDRIRVVARGEDNVFVVVSLKGEMVR
jgi:hypothetical protein